MAEIIPAILADNFKTVAERLRFLAGAVQWVQLDVTDGVFAPGITWNNPEELKTVRCDLSIEAHLMVEDPEDYVGDWCRVARRTVIHYESGGRLEETLQLVKQCSLESGVALLCKTPLEVIDFYRPQIDLVQLMSIDEIGAQGHSFQPAVFGRIKTLKTKYPDLKISVDGGVSLENAAALVSVGADNLIVGAGIWQNRNPLRALRQFQNLCISTTTR